MRLRRTAAFYGLVFLLLVAAAPHHHLNAFEDLVSDGPSDSGTFVPQPPPSDDPLISSAEPLDDDPCLACFQNDYAAAASFVFFLASQSRFVSLRPSAADPEAPGPGWESLQSRSPPLPICLS